MSWRRDPRAMRTAISRDRSAARAANRLPRLAQAASRMRPARSMSPAIKARVGRPRVFPASPGCDSEELQTVIRFGIGFGQRICNGVQVRGGRGWRDSGLEMADDPGVMVAALFRANLHSAI